MRMRLVVGTMVLGVGIGAFLFAQEPQPLPGQTSGIVRVAGSVEVANSPTVLSQQLGEWKVGIANVPDVRVVNTPTVSVATPDFLRKGSRWRITWANGEGQVVEVVQTTGGGWVRVAAGARQRWINLATVRSVEDVQ
jgi:hypothetical protein